MNRRSFVRAVPGALAVGITSASGLILFTEVKRKQSATNVREGLEPGILRPPGALREDRFLAACIRCQKCTQACPTGAVRIAGAADPAPTGTPYIAAADRGCNLCLACTEACPTEALRPTQHKEDVDMGLAVVDERTCVSHNRTGVCGACFTVCPLRGDAITLGLRNAPTVHSERCVGCGLCEEACILHGTKAIRVFSGRLAS